MGWFFVGGAATTAQPARFAYDVQAYGGALFRYQRNTQQLLFTRPYGVEMTGNRLPTGRHAWEQLYGGPTVGVTLSYTDFGSAHELGRVAGLTTQFRMPLRRFRRGWLEMDPGVGISYASRPFDLVHNPFQKAYSTHVSILLRGNLNYYRLLTRRWVLIGSLGYRHFSNGALRTPNNGMNYLLVGGGLRYQPAGASVPARPETPAAPADTSWRLQLAGTVGWKQVTFASPLRATYLGNLTARRRVGRYASLTAGADLIYDPTYDRDYAARLIEVRVRDPWKAGVTAGVELHIGALGVLGQMGWMAYDPHRFDGRLYQRFGLRYEWTRRWFVRATLRAYSRRAECLEWGGGFSF